ncbi:hypothetical protein PAECIP111891_07055 [Paenibacillus allorhizoplanae]|uniref:DUF4362 domain-containing protein n=1 Tax=Paenibacillus allorhizoplanae TaxID=2905648 RepID=A0ABN8HB11_9BACL|nr:DUF4362 domain-containing protein [Paenibacillus allorhizoplanae]CAH1232608.1 hypothetical protein PAECIP111891_07055 [Paenibacillus allorhizoplanae]
MNRLAEYSKYGIIAEVENVYKKPIIYIQLIVFIGLVSAIFVLLNQQSHKENTNKNKSIIINFDQVDLDRVDEMVKRFNEGKGDNLMIISPTIDSGPLIHDVNSNGKEIHWIVDNTRDAWAGTDKGKTEFVCKSISMNERDDEFFDVELSKCNNFKEDEQLRLISFRKEIL